MASGITYFRLNSPYEGDITKNCGLDGFEVDNNFFTLEGRDVKFVYVEDDKIKIGLVNGETISSDNVFGNFTKDLVIDFDKSNGILYVTQNGVTKTLTGFLTTLNDDNVSATDSTIKGDGKPTNPLGLSPSYMTGQYKPVNAYVDLSVGDTLPTNPKAGDRYLVKDEISDYGLLYDYEGVKRIVCDLAGSHSEWRLPTKEDWDDMLNAVEPCQEYRDHESGSCNKWLGKYAGKFLKSVDFWKTSSNGTTPGQDTCIDYSDNGCGCNCGHNTPCSPVYCGEYNGCTHRNNCGQDTNGIDMYGFNVTPAGYADDGGNVNYFGERAAFWTATNANCGSSAYMKRFEWDKSKVYQDIYASGYMLSLRLVKDYNGSNYFEKEEIIGYSTPTVLMPSLKNGSAVWTSVNIAFANRCYNPMQPNNGQSLTNTVHYYMYNWDGMKWVVNELHEGESVVVLQAGEDRYSIEYKVEHGELVDVELDMAGEVLEVVEERINDIDGKIDAEVTRATERENSIETNLNTLTQEVANIGERLDGEITSRIEQGDGLTQAIGNVDQKLDDFIDEMRGTIVPGVDTITEAINEEKNAREAKDAEIEGKLIVQDGTSFDGDTGILTLKSQGGNDDVTVQFTFNFGEI
ncbi:MAG: hypothetical protein J6Y37_13465 [Paludibacteraceae bacterium]|nr:hypothetical protein [Paludibacteraceae bacterium]